MLRFLSLFILLFLSLNADDKVEIFASDMKSVGNVVKANGGVTVIYKDYFLTADRAVYDRDSGELELFDNIRVNQGKSYKILGKYAKLNIEKKEKLFQPFYLSDRDSQVWISADEGKSNNNDIDISSGALSGCNPNDPLWLMEFSSSDYNAKTKWMNVYNARLYIEDIPVFYMPYFGYSLDTTRRSGLLMPSAGFSDNEGIFYEQPIYIAEQNWWDLELRPQIRTFRGQGVYETFRFVDSNTSHGEFKSGYFREYEEYFLTSNLHNDTHYGYTFKYDNNDFINQWLGTTFSGQSGLYVDINHMNDVDYINLSSNDTQNNSTATQVLSRINMFYNTDDNYIGSYFKYYQDLTLVSNDNTLQKLPTLQYHHYLDTLFQEHLSYSLDIQSNNIQRNINKKVVQTDMNIPITLQTSLFDEYINLSYKANIYGQQSTFGGEETNASTNATYRDGYILRNHHTLSISSQVTRGYDEFSHVVGFGASYNKAGTETRNGYYSDIVEFCSNEENKDSSQCEFYNITDVKDEVQIDFTQYVYNSSAQEILYHRLAQKISYAKNVDRLGELSNELNYRVTDYLSFYNNMFYNYDKALFSKVFNSLSFSKYGLDVALSHLYKDSFIPSTTTTPQYTSYLTSSVGYTYNQHYSFSGLYNYDMEKQETKSREIGFMYKKRCWDFGIRYSENNRPILTDAGESSVYDKYVYLTIVLKPLMKPDGTSLLTYQLPNAQ